MIHNLLDSKSVVVRPKESEEEINNTQKKFMIDHELTTTLMAQDVLLN